MKEITKHLIPLTHLGFYLSHGYANGYVGVPEGHPWHGVDYDSIDASVHGGLTYAGLNLPQHEPSEPGYWYVGFDTAHYGDNPDSCDERYCQAELDRLAEQAEAARGEQYAKLSE